MTSDEPFIGATLHFGLILTFFVGVLVFFFFFETRSIRVLVLLSHYEDLIFNLAFV